MEGLRKALFGKKVDGLLVDSYVADSRRNLFSDLLIKQVIDLRSSYGVVMGTDASKIRKCINKYWKDNAAIRTEYIKENSKPVVPTEISTAEIVGDSLSHEGDMYTLTLTICFALFCVGCFCGCIYEVIRRKRRATKVEPEGENICDVKHDLEREISGFMEKLQNNIEKLRTKHKKEIIALGKLKRKNKKIKMRTLRKESKFKLSTHAC